jgi:hypothetical protein
MATFYSTEQAVINGPQYGQPPATRVKVNRINGRIRNFEASYTVPPGGIAIADKIVWGKLPLGARTMGNMGKLYFAAGTASSTINLGDNVSAARHLAATSVAAAGSAVPEAANAAGAQFETTDDSNSVANAFSSATDNATLISVVAGAALLAGQVITLRMPYVQD